MPHCFVVGCRNTTRNSDDISFHSFPKNEKTRKQWLNLIGRDPNSIIVYERVCSEHFSEDVITLNGNRKYLDSNNAIPMKYLPNSKLEKRKYSRKYDDFSSSLESTSSPDVEPSFKKVKSQADTSKINLISQQMWYPSGSGESVIAIDECPTPTPCRLSTGEPRLQTPPPTPPLSTLQPVAVSEVTVIAKMVDGSEQCVTMKCGMEPIAAVRVEGLLSNPLLYINYINNRID